MRPGSPTSPVGSPVHSPSQNPSTSSTTNPRPRSSSTTNLRDDEAYTYYLNPPATFIRNSNNIYSNGNQRLSSSPLTSSYHHEIGVGRGREKEIEREKDRRGLNGYNSQEMGGVLHQNNKQNNITNGYYHNKSQNGHSEFIQSNNGKSIMDRHFASSTTGMSSVYNHHDALSSKPYLSHSHSDRNRHDIMRNEIDGDETLLTLQPSTKPRVLPSFMAATTSVRNKNKNSIGHLTSGDDAAVFWNPQLNPFARPGRHSDAYIRSDSSNSNLEYDDDGYYYSSNNYNSSNGSKTNFRSTDPLRLRRSSSSSNRSRSRSRSRSPNIDKKDNGTDRNRHLHKTQRDGNTNRKHLTRPTVSSMAKINDHQGQGSSYYNGDGGQEVEMNKGMEGEGLKRASTAPASLGHAYQYVNSNYYSLRGGGGNQANKKGNRKKKALPRFNTSMK